MDINGVNLVGRFVRDVEVKTFGETTVANFSLAVNMRKKDEVSFFNCTAFGKLVDIISKYTSKGKQVAVSGYLKQNRYQDKEGQNKSSVNIIVENLQLLGSKPTSDHPEAEAF